MPSGIELRIAWNEASDMLGLWNEGWPDALTPDQIGRLHAWDGPDTKPNQTKADALAGELKRAIEVGELPTIVAIQDEPPLVSFLDDPESLNAWRYNRPALRRFDCARHLHGVSVGRYLESWLLSCTDETIIASDATRRAMWFEVRDFLGVNGNDWPAVLSVEQVAALQTYSAPGAKGSEIRAPYNAFLRFILAEIDAGRIAARRDTVTWIRAVKDTRRLIRFEGFGFEAEHAQRHRTTSRVEKREEQCAQTTVSAGAACRGLQSLKRGKYLDAWLKPYLAGDGAVPDEQGRGAVRPFSQQRWQEDEILRVVESMKLDPLALPPYEPGKSGVKAEVRKSLKFSISVFDKAWERLKKDGRIQFAGGPVPQIGGQGDTCGGG